MSNVSIYSLYLLYNQFYADDVYCALLAIDEILHMTRFVDNNK